MKARKLKKFQFPNSLVNWEKFGSTVAAEIQGPNFQSFSRIGKH